jgi:uncharacterized LabA/DUF88 family protein
LMVLVQILAYGKVNDTRVRKKSARAAAKAERERKAAQKDQKLASDTRTTTMNGHVSETVKAQDTTLPPNTKNAMNGRSTAAHNKCAAPHSNEDLQYIEDSTTEPSSEEETIV